MSLAIMKFYVSASHVTQLNRKRVYVCIFLVALSAGCIAAIASAKSLMGMVYPAIGIFVFTPPILRTRKLIKEGASWYPVVDLDETARKLAVSHKDMVVTVDVSQIKNLRLQRKSGRLVSAILTTSSGEVIRFEGYENLEVLASTLERLTPKDRVTNAKFYHR